MRFIGLSLIFLLNNALLFAQPQLKWEKFLNNTNPNLDLGISNQQVDNQGNIYLCGYEYTDNGANSFLSKYDTNGVQIWKQVFAVPNFVTNFNYMQLDSSHLNIYVNGVQMSEATGDTLDLLLCKYNQNGVLQWSKTYSAPGSSYDFPSNLTLDKNNNIISGGYSILADTVNNTSTQSAFIVKYNTNGNFLWNYNYTNPIAPGADGIYQIAVDNYSNIYAYISGMGSLDYQDAITIKLSPNSSLLWEYRNTGVYGGAATQSMIVNKSTEEVFTTSATSTLSTGIYRGASAFQKIDKFGVPVWTAIYSDTSHYGFENPMKLFQHANGSFYIVGHFSNGVAIDWDIMILKYSKNGVFEWSKYYNSGNGGMDQLKDAKMDLEGNIFVASQLIDSAFSSSVLNTLKFDSLGNFQCSIIKSTPSPNFLDNQFLDIDNHGNVYTSTNIAFGPLVGNLVKYSNWNCLSTGIEEKSAIDKVSIFPNPVSNMLHLQFENILENGRVEFYNAVGQLVYNTPIKHVDQTSIDMSPFSKGIYYVVITDKSHTARAKIIKE